MSVKLNVRMEMPGKDPKEFNYDFDQETILLGRDKDNDIQIPLTTVSRNHARIFKEGGDWFLEDLKSTHGTVHNGKPVGSGGKKLLRNGDTIELMHFKISFESTGEKPLEVGQSERTEMLARRMVQEVLNSIGGGAEAPYVRVMNGPDEGKRFVLGDGVGEVVIGRATECDFPINDANISRRHALIRKDWSGITVEDLGSKNGVTVNDRKIEKPTQLKDSDEISLGAVKLTFIDPTASLLGKLDDIPVFKSEEPPPEEPSDEPSSEQEAPREPSSSSNEQQEASPPSGESSIMSEVPGEGGDGEKAEGEGGGSSTDQDTQARPPKGAADYLVYAAIGLVVVGLAAAGGVVVWMMR